jgi:hypothetical protein
MTYPLPYYVMTHVHWDWTTMHIVEVLVEAERKRPRGGIVYYKAYRIATDPVLDGLGQTITTGFTVDASMITESMKELPDEELKAAMIAHPDIADVIAEMLKERENVT